MDKIKIGIPRGLFYYYDGTLWKNFFDFLQIPYLVSEKTSRTILDLGNHYATDEMCLSLKTYLGHVASLQGKCTTVLVPRIDNYGSGEQTCTNFLATYDIVANLFKTPILHYNIAYEQGEKEESAFIKMGEQLGITAKASREAYKQAREMTQKTKNQLIIHNYNQLNGRKIRVLIIAHPYVIYDEALGGPILEILKNQNIEVIFSDRFDSDIASKLGQKLSTNLYWKYSKELIGSLKLVEFKIDGILFISTFPCGPDALVNELMLRKINLPHLSLIIDDMDSIAGMETRLESFADILEIKKNQKNH